MFNWIFGGGLAFMVLTDPRATWENIKIALTFLGTAGNIVFIAFLIILSFYLLAPNLFKKILKLLIRTLKYLEWYLTH